MECLFINLPKAEARRKSFENTFQRHADLTWGISRFNAIDKEFILSERIQGTCSPSQKACFLSHKLALKSQLNNNQNIFILEDDALFGGNTSALINQAINSEYFSSFDILFAVVTLCDFDIMLALLNMKHQLKKSGSINIFRLKGFRFYSTIAYIVNGRSKEKVFQILEDNANISLPIDDFYCECVQSDLITAGVIFPFAVGNAELGDASQIRETSAARDLIESGFSLSRVLGWADAAEEDWNGYMQKINSAIGKERYAIGVARTAVRVASEQLATQKILIE